MFDENDYKLGMAGNAMAMKHRAMVGWVAVMLLVATGTGYADLTSGLVGYWSFDDPSDLGHDDSGTGNNCYPVGGVTWTTGVVSGGAHFNGTGYIRVPDSPSLDLPGARGTIAAFVRIDPSSNMSNEFGVSKESSSSYPSTIGYEFLIRESAAGKWVEYYVISNGSTINYIGNDGGESLKDALWHHIALTWSGPGGKVLAYRDGVVVAECNQTISTLNNIPEPLLIGAYRWNVPPGILRRMLGDMDEVRIYNRALSADEIRQLTSSVVPVAVDIKPGSCPNPLNVKDQGVLPVAILGSRDFDVFTVDPASVRLEGVAPVRSSYEDVAAPVTNRRNECDCTTDGPDGHLDLVLKFDTQRVVNVLGPCSNGDTFLLTLTGTDLGGTPIEGKDCVVIVGKGGK
jgi:hypothetical protein